MAADAREELRLSGGRNNTGTVVKAIIVSSRRRKSRPRVKSFEHVKWLIHGVVVAHSVFHPSAYWQITVQHWLRIDTKVRSGRVTLDARPVPEELISVLQHAVRIAAIGAETNFGSRNLYGRFLRYLRNRYLRKIMRW